MIHTGKWLNLISIILLPFLVMLITFPIAGIGSIGDGAADAPDWATSAFTDDAS